MAASSGTVTLVGLVCTPREKSPFKDRPSVPKRTFKKNTILQSNTIIAHFWPTFSCKYTCKYLVLAQIHTWNSGFAHGLGKKILR